MGKDFPKVRRKNREVVDDAIIKQHLHKMPFGFIASSNDHQPFINCNLFYYSEEDNTVYFHTARRGATEDNFRTNSKTCFSIGALGRFLPADEVLEFTTEYLNVVVYGRTEIVTDPDKIVFVLRQYFTKYFPRTDYSSLKPFTLEDAMKTTVFAIRIDHWTCKSNSWPGEFPGSFDYSENLDRDYLKEFGKYVK